MLAQRLQAKPKPHEDPLLCDRLLQQEAAIFSQSPMRHQWIDAARVRRAGISKRIDEIEIWKRWFLLIMRIENQWNSLLRLVHKPGRHNPAVSRRYFDKMAASYDMARIPQS